MNYLEQLDNRINVFIASFQEAYSEGDMVVAEMFFQLALKAQDDYEFAKIHLRAK